MLWDEKVESYRQLEQFLKSCLDPTTDEVDFTAALRSVPQDSWSTVQSRLSTDLDNEINKNLPSEIRPVTANLGPGGTLDLLNLLWKKKEILNRERQERLRNRR